MGLTEGQQDAIVLEHGLMLAQQRDIMARSRAICTRTEALQPAAPAADSNTHGVRLRGPAWNLRGTQARSTTLHQSTATH